MRGQSSVRYQKPVRRGGRFGAKGMVSVSEMVASKLIVETM